jgi:hypothetical protein
MKSFSISGEDSGIQRRAMKKVEGEGEKKKVFNFSFKFIVRLLFSRVMRKERSAKKENR